MKIIKYLTCCVVFLMFSNGCAMADDLSPEKVGIVYYFGFKIEPIAGMPEQYIEEYGDKYSIERFCFFDVITKAVDVNKYEKRNVRAKITFNSEAPFYIDKEGNVSHEDQFYRVDKEKFVRCLKFISKSTHSP